MFIRHSPQRRLHGAVLVDYIVSLLIGSLVSAVVASALVMSQRSFTAVLNYFELDRQSRGALDDITTEARQANRLSYGDDSILMFEELDGDPLYYIYSQGPKGWLYKINDGELTILLEGVDELEFALFQRNPIEGSRGQYPAATAET